jgi:hypothetical protein
MALDDPEPLLGIHVTTPEIGPYTGPGSRRLSADERDYQERFERWCAEEWRYLEIRSTKPQTLGFALNDSPAGLAAWIVESGGAGSTRMETSTATSRGTWASRTSRSTGRPRRSPPRCATTTTTADISPATPPWCRGLGVAPDGREYDALPPREWIERLCNLVHWTEMPAGGPCAAVEEPRLFSADVASSSTV